MSKTPEEMAAKYASDMVLRDKSIRGSNYREEGCMRRGFLAGFEASRNKYEAQITELKANFTFCCEDKARLLQELAAKEDKS